MDYDPDRAPEPAAWLALDEQERIDLVLAHHKDSGAASPNARLHAVFHVAVENQIAEAGEVPAAQTLDRLMQEGLDRHQAVHAISSVVARHIIDLYNSEGAGAEMTKEYCRNLAQLRAENWRNLGI